MRGSWRFVNDALRKVELGDVAKKLVVYERQGDVRLSAIAQYLCACTESPTDDDTSESDESFQVSSFGELDCRTGFSTAYHPGSLHRAMAATSGGKTISAASESSEWPLT
jgi:hypothetical protein